MRTRARTAWKKLGQSLPLLLTLPLTLMNVQKLSLVALLPG